MRKSVLLFFAAALALAPAAAQQKRYEHVELELDDDRPQATVGVAQAVAAKFGWRVELPE